MMALDRSCQVGRAPLSVRGPDLYETPAVAVRALMVAERLPSVIWEPSCGTGGIVNLLRAAGHLVYATDLYDHGCSDSDAGRDFLLAREPSFAIDAIVTNPPYRLANRFVAHALTLAIPKVIMLLRLAFLESEGRRAILDSGLLARVYVFRNRLPRMHRAGWTGRRASGAVPYAWFVWDLGYRGLPIIHRISWSAV